MLSRFSALKQHVRSLEALPRQLRKKPSSRALSVTQSVWNPLVAGREPDRVIPGVELAGFIVWQGRASRPETGLPFKPSAASFRVFRPLALLRAPLTASSGGSSPYKGEIERN